METRRILDFGFWILDGSRTRHPIQNPKSKIQNRQGFTLVEVLVAVAVLAIGISAGVRALGAMAQSSAAAEDRETAIGLAGERLAVLEAGIETGNAEGVFETEPRFRWQQSLAASTEQPGVLETTVTVTWLDGVVERHYAVTTYLPDTPTEVTTTTGGEQ